MLPSPENFPRNSFRNLFYLPACVVFSLEHTFFSFFLSTFEEELGEESSPCNTITSLNITEDRRRLFGAQVGDSKFVGLWKSSMFGEDVFGTLTSLLFVEIS